MSCKSADKDSVWSEEAEKPYKGRKIEKSVRSYIYKKNVSLFPGAEYAIYHFDYDVELPEKGFPEDILRVMRQNILSLVFGKTIRNADWDNVVYSNVDYLVAGWKRDHQEDYRDEFNSDYDSPMMEERDYIKGRMLDPYNGIVSYVCDSYGPGYNSYKRSVNMDVNTGRIIHESSLFRPGYRQILRDLLMEYLPERIDKQYVGSLREFQPSECFYVTKEGITYIYPQGEIGSMADGVVEVTIPWDAFTLLRVK